ncbi:Metallo-beta-lactamase domain-containing protein 1 [Toxocara canis]|uniref:Metallo-beta-lactamase domain-containing protein 1 n=2 Tax=Toxocara canis TaxID=6265 RepID=A0A0B2VCZ6_TOXCA|nr:Metallo-beta-lactamase domain-containing protein 1 [Toxocara canis]VDM25110.1 unnamed protein product [Toxocara canis]
MAPIVEQLLVGYSQQSTTYRECFSASGSVTLVTDGCHKILVDCGNPWNGQHLLNELRARSLEANDITEVVVTHGHSDHCGNLSLFQLANIFMDRDHARPCSEYASFEDDFKITANVHILRTPGHTDNDLSVIVYGTQQGCIVIAGDIFEDDKTDDWEPNSRYKDEQRRSRDRIVATADWIVPGHGRMFRNEFKTPEFPAADEKSK